ncbi:MAG: hypothetical protein IJ126_07555 [Lachnospiraceae bacterium]|nr:hypothetical protein [Lachnospiraceae bacterium]
MKNKLRLTAILVAVAMLSVTVFTGCGGSGSSGKKDTEEPAAVQEAQAEAEAPAEAEAAKEETAAETPAETTKADAPTAEDAKAYVKAILDIMCTGDYDHSVNLSDIPEGEEANLRDSTIESAVAAIASDSGLSEDVQAEFAEVMREAFAKSKYTVGDAVPTEDGGYDVTVTIEPLKLYAGAQTKLAERITQDDIAGLSEENANNLIYSKIAEIIRENLEEPEYGEPQDVVVHYGLIDEQNNIWGVSEEEGEKLGEVLFSADME